MQEARSTCWVLAALVAAFLLAATSSASASPRHPPAFADSMHATMTGAHSLWVFVANERGPRQNQITAYRQAKGGWARDRTLSLAASPDYDILSATPPNISGSPCLGYVDVREGSHVICRLSGGWRQIYSVRRADGVGEITDLAQARDGAFILFRDTDSKGTTATLIRVGIDGSAYQVTDPLQLPQALVGLSDGPGPVVTVEELNSGRRYAIEPDVDGWHRVSAVFHDAAEGPMIGGGATLGELQFLPVTDTATRPWRFSVYSTRPEAKWRAARPQPLDSGRRDAQGIVSRVGTTVYAMWQEQHQVAGAFRTRIALAAYDADSGRFERARTLWRGRGFGPDTLDAAQVGYRHYAMYVRGTQGGRHSELTIERVR